LESNSLIKTSLSVYKDLATIFNSFLVSADNLGLKIGGITLKFEDFRTEFKYDFVGKILVVCK